MTILFYFLAAQILITFMLTSISLSNRFLNVNFTSIYLINVNHLIFSCTIIVLSVVLVRVSPQIRTWLLSAIVPKNKVGTVVEIKNCVQIQHNVESVEMTVRQNKQTSKEVADQMLKEWCRIEDKLLKTQM